MDEPKKRIVVGQMSPITMSMPEITATGSAIQAADGRTLGASAATARGTMIVSGSGQAQGESKG